MFVYSKLVLRFVILCALVLGAIVMSRPAPVAAYQDCCQTCQNEYTSCLSDCGHDVSCRIGCARELKVCGEGCGGC
jgi:hypothetical protein